MSDLLIKEQSFTCPCCGSGISMLLELGHGNQNYVEDCEVCCSPIDISYRVDEGFLADFCASPAQP